MLLEYGYMNLLLMAVHVQPQQASNLLNLLSISRLCDIKFSALNEGQGCGLTPLDDSLQVTSHHFTSLHLQDKSQIYISAQLWQVDDITTGLRSAKAVQR